MGMSRAQVKEILGENATEDIVDRLLGLHTNDIGSFKSKISELNAQLEVFAEQESELQALKNEKMSDQERLDATIREAEAAKRDYLSKMARVEAREIFVSAGLSEDEYTPLLDSVVTEDSELTKAKSQAIVDVMSSRLAATEKSLREQLLKNTPAPPDGEQGSEVRTITDFLNLPYEQQLEMKEKNPEILDTLEQ